MNFLKIAWRDVSSIFKNRFIRVSVIGIIIVPLLYSLLYLAAFWDPYSRLTSMPVAVVNLDEGSTKDSSEVNYGDDVVKNLKDNSELGWKFVGLKEAQDGVKGNKYYSMFVIPKDFSKNVLSAKDGKPQQPKILYKSNDGKNFLAAQIGGKVEVLLKAEISKTITKEYTQITFDNLYDVKDGFKQAADGSKQLNDGMVTAKDGSTQIMDGLGTLNSNTGALKDGVGQLSNGATALANGISQAQSGLAPAANKLNDSKDLLSLIQPHNATNMRSILVDSSKLKDADTSMLNMVPTLITQKNMQLAQNTIKDYYALNVTDIMKDPLVQQLKSLATSDNLANVNKMMGDVNTLTGALPSIMKVANIASPAMPLLSNDKFMGDFVKLLNDGKDLYSKNETLKGMTAMATPENMGAIGKLIDDGEALNSKYVTLKGMTAMATNDNMTALGSVMDSSKYLYDNKVDLTSMLPKEADVKSVLALNGINTTGNVGAINKSIETAVMSGTINSDPITGAAIITDADKAKAITEMETLVGGGSQVIGNASTQYTNLTKIPNLGQNITAMSGALKTLGDAGLFNDKTYLYTKGALTDLPQMNLGEKLDDVHNVAPLLNDATKGALNALPTLGLSSKLDDLKAVGDVQVNGQNLFDGTTTMLGQLAANKTDVATLLTLTSNLNTIATDLNNNKQNLAAVQTLLAKVNDPSTAATIQKIQTLQGDITAAQPLVSTLTSQMTPANMAKIQNSPQLVNQLLSMQKELKDNEKILDVTQNALSDGNIEMANKLVDSIPTLTDGVTKLANGSQQLATGLTTLNGKVPALVDGVSKLYTGSKDLNDGMGKLNDGSKELSDKLADGSDKINKSLVNSSSDMATFVSEPLKISEQPINPVKNYGTGFTPYFIPLSLWVGAIMMFFVITDKVDNDIKASSASVVAGKFLSYGYIGIMQAVLVSTVVLFLGLKPQSYIAYYLFNILMSYVFIAIIQCLIFLLGDPGRLIAIAILILQLTSCAGTFPLEVVPKFFKVLNPYMPFTYCVSALREIISGTNYTVLWKDVTILACIMFGFLFISILMKGHMDKVQELIEKKKEEAASNVA